MEFFILQSVSLATGIVLGLVLTNLLWYFLFRTYINKLIKQFEDIEID